MGHAFLIILFAEDGISLFFVKRACARLSVYDCEFTPSFGRDLFGKRDQSRADAAPPLRLYHGYPAYEILPVRALQQTTRPHGFSAF